MKYLIPAIIILVASISCTAEKRKASSKIAKKPNIILFLADDLGSGDLACMGHPYVKSPNLDQFVSEATSFERGYVAAGWCAPSRYGIMRGLYPGREFYQEFILDKDQPTMTSIFQNEGYKTAHFGKWHLGGTKLANFGIDTHFSFNGPEDPISLQEKRTKEFRANSTKLLVNKAMDFIKNTDGNPFYINLWVQPTHSTIDPTDEQLAVYKDLKIDVNDFKSPHQREFLKTMSKYGDIEKGMQAYCADVTQMDTEFGRLMKFLKDNKLDENTIVIFSSDNGPAPIYRTVENEGAMTIRMKDKPKTINDLGAAKGYFRRKSSVHEGGVHVPLVVRWPRKIPAKINKSTIIATIDLIPSLTALASIDLPEDYKFDGKDMSHILVGKEEERGAPLYWFENKSTAAVLNGHWKIVEEAKGNIQLYDLSKDKGETNNLIEKNTEKAAEMKALLDNWKKELPTPTPWKYIKDRNHD